MRPWSRSGLWSCGRTAGSSRGNCLGTSMRRSTSRATSTSRPREAGLRRRCEKAIIDFDRDGRLSVHGLPKCPVGRIENATPKEARRVCSGGDRRHRARRRDDRPAGEGADSGLLAADPVQRRTPERQPDGHPPCPHHRPRGADLRDRGADRTAPRRLRATAPRSTSRRSPAGFGALTHIDAKVGRRYSLRRPQAQLHVGPLLRRHPRHPRPLRLRRQTRDIAAPSKSPAPRCRRQRLPILARPGPLAQLVRAGAS